MDSQEVLAAETVLEGPNSVRQRSCILGLAAPLDNLGPPPRRDKIFANLPSLSVARRNHQSI